MRYSYLIIIFFISAPFFLQAEEPTITHNGATNPIFHNNNNNFYVLTISTENITKYCTNLIHDTMSTDNQSIKNLLWEKRYTIGATTFACCYGAASYLLLADYYYITGKGCWSQWKSDCSFEQLCALSQQDLSKELLFTIGQRTFNHQKPANTLHPLMSFINDINDEIIKIERYIKTAKTIKQWGLMRIFPTNDNKIGHAEKLFERAHFIKHIFLSWFATHSFTA